VGAEGRNRGPQPRKKKLLLARRRRIKSGNTVSEACLIRMMQLTYTYSPLFLTTPKRTTPQAWGHEKAAAKEEKNKVFSIKIEEGMGVTPDPYIRQ